MAANADMAAAWDGPEGDYWADHADRYQATTRRYRRLLLDALDLSEHSSVVDIGCGTGALSIDAGRIASGGAVLGVDLSSRMLADARAKASAAGLDHVRFEQADAQTFTFRPRAYDVATSSFGAMFFDDPAAAFANIGRSLRPGAPFVQVAWRHLDRNDWVAALRAALAAGRRLPTPPPGTPGPFSLAYQTTTAQHLAAAGYRNIEFTSIDEPVWLGDDADDAFSFMSNTSFARALTAHLDDAARMAALGELQRTLEEHETGDGVLLAGSAWLIRATLDETAGG